MEHFRKHAVVSPVDMSGDSLLHEKFHSLHDNCTSVWAVICKFANG